MKSVDSNEIVIKYTKKYIILMYKENVCYGFEDLMIKNIGITLTGYFSK